MPPAERWCVWMNAPSFYQADFFAELRANRIDLKVMYGAHLDNDRRALGWPKAPLEEWEAILDSASAKTAAVREVLSGEATLHIVNGIWAVPRFGPVLASLVCSNGRYLLHGEGRDPGRRRSPGLELVKKSLGKQVCARAVGGLAIGEHSRRLFRELGMDEARIVPFGYFRADQGHGQLETERRSERDEVVFVGQLIDRKGGDILIRATETLPPMSRPKLVFVGIGPARASWEAEAQRRLGPEGAEFAGSLDARLVLSRLQGARALVLPSRFDGWGLVVNEALMAGTPAIVSDACGASELVRDGVNGYLFRADDATGLGGALARLIALSGGARARMRANAARVGKALTARVAARYAIEAAASLAAESSPPVPPWIRSLDECGAPV